MLYRWIGGGKERKERRGLVLLQVQFIPFGPFVCRIALLLRYNFLYRVDVPFVETILSSSHSLFPFGEGRREKLAEATLWCIGESVACRERGGGGRPWKKCPCKGDFSSFHPQEGIPTLSTAILYLTTSKFLRNRLPFFRLPRYNTELPSFPAIRL